MKRYIASVSALAIALAAMAVPAKRIQFTADQADGTTITLTLSGDESCHAYLTDDGLTVAKASDGTYRYITPDGTLSQVKAHNPGHRTQAEAAFLQLNANKLTLSAKAAYRSSEPAKVKAGGKQMVRKESQRRKMGEVLHDGQPRVPVFLVQYPDVKFIDSDPKATFEKFFNDGSQSARQYFVDQSFGQFNPQFDIYGPYTTKNKRSYYGSGDEDYAFQMVTEACQYYDSQIDYSLYDNNGDGVCEQVLIIYAGVGEASSNLEESVWPHQSAFSYSDGTLWKLDNIGISAYAVFNERYGYAGRYNSYPAKIDGIGTFCHEFSHCLGLPDFYTVKGTTLFGMDRWSLMDYGCYNNDGYTPSSYTAYERAFMGWMELIDAEPDTQYTLSPINDINDDKHEAVVMVNDQNPQNELYILENRAKTDWDAYALASGLMVTHVNFVASDWRNNTVNSNGHEYMTILPADNSRIIHNDNGLKGDLYPYAGNDSITPNSRPKPTLFTGGVLNKPVTEITRNADGTVSFFYMKTKGPKELPPVETLFKDENPIGWKFTAVWTELDEQYDVTYTLEVAMETDLKEALVLSQDCTAPRANWLPADGTGPWTCTGSVAPSIASNKGTGISSGGELTSPEINAAGRQLITVEYEAKAYSQTSHDIRFHTVTDGVASAATARELEYTTDWGTYIDVVEVKGDGTCRLVIGADKGCRLKNIKVYLGDVSQELEKKYQAPARRAAADEADDNSGVTETGDDTYRLITGIRGNKYTIDNLQLLRAFRYRVKAVPVDTETYKESPWTDWQYVDLSTTGIESVSGDAEGEAPAEYYTLQGMRVAAGALTPGIYVRRQGTRTDKVVIR